MTFLVKDSHIVHWIKSAAALFCHFHATPIGILEWYSNKTISDDVAPAFKHFSVNFSDLLPKCDMKQLPGYIQISQREFQMIWAANCQPRLCQSDILMALWGQWHTLHQFMNGNCRSQRKLLSLATLLDLNFLKVEVVFRIMFILEQGGLSHSCNCIS